MTAGKDWRQVVVELALQLRAGTIQPTQWIQLERVLNLVHSRGCLASPDEIIAFLRDPRRNTSEICERIFQLAKSGQITEEDLDDILAGSITTIGATKINLAK